MRLSSTDMEWLLTELAYTVERGRPLPPTLRDMAASQGDSRRGTAAAALAQAMENGASLSEAISRQARNWRPGLAEATAIGERSGRLPHVLRSQADGLHQQCSLRSSVARALAYPFVVGLGASAAMLFIHGYIEPMFMRMYEELDVWLPKITSLMPGLQIVAIAFFFLPLMALMLLYLIPAGWLPGGSLFERARLSFPLVGGAMKHMLLARWCDMLAQLFAAGVPEPLAVRLAGDGAGSPYVRRISRRVSDSISQGRSLGQALAEHGFFSPMLVWMVDTARQTGSHLAVWPVARDMHDDQARMRLVVVSTVLSVFFVLTAFVLLFMTIVSLFLPLFKLMNSIGG